MPLVIITGLPSSGKTHRAQQILTDFESRIACNCQTSLPHIPTGVTVQHLNSYHASQDPAVFSPNAINPTKPPPGPRELIYNSAREEKTARAEEFSSTKRALSKNNIVILDAPNYIKGFRYQLWCEAKAVGTRCVVVHAAAREAECKIWNDERIKAWGLNAILKQENENDKRQTGPIAGKDVRGELQPESHTAIYGDRLINDNIYEGSRSRSSSMGDGLRDDDGDKEQLVAETMTLKSLYISGGRPDVNLNGTHTSNGRTTQLETVASQQDVSLPEPNTVPSNLPHPAASMPYTSATLQSLAMRYEPPSPFTRWDTPLFTVPSSDVHPPYQAIWDAIYPPSVKATKKTVAQLRPGEIAETRPEDVRRHAATVLPKATGAEALQNLESATADTVKILLASAREQGMADGEGGDLSLSVLDPKGGGEILIDIEIPINTILSQPALQRLRRKYTQIQRGGIAHGQGYVDGRAAIVRDFSKFLQSEWNTD